VTPAGQNVAAKRRRDIIRVAGARSVGAAPRGPETVMRYREDKLTAGKFAGDRIADLA
jgi:hypothetical protein